MRFSEGQCILSSPGYRAGTEGSVPYPLKITIPGADKKRAAESEPLWEQYLRPALQQQVSDIDPDSLMQGLYERIRLAEALLPLPENGQSSGASMSQPVPDPKRPTLTKRPSTDALDFMA